jgi:predicted Rossmann fold flavoprotein
MGLFGFNNLERTFKWNCTFDPMSNKAVVVGGGAAGFFAAIRLAELRPDLEVLLLEKSSTLLGKVKISGGGRCNVTHACFEPKQLVKFYPRGEKELIGPFHKFQPGDIFDWFERRGVQLKTEDDNRVFPVTDNSQTIIDTFMAEASKLGVRIWTQCGVQEMQQLEDGSWKLSLSNGTEMEAAAVLVTTGSSTQVWNMLENLGHSINEPVPSLFTFNIKDKRIDGLAGVSSANCEVHIEGTRFEAQGPVLVTHWGLSGPGILKLSSWAARELANVKYDFIIRVNWDARFDREQAIDFLKAWRDEHAKAQVKTFSAMKVPHRLWLALLSEKPEVLEMKWADVSNKNLEWIADAFVRSYFQVKGKSTNKDEFVTAGGIVLSEVDFRSMSSKVKKNLFFAGEVLDIDAVTGGFNFQAAWTTSWLAAEGISNALP